MSSSCKTQRQYAKSVVFLDINSKQPENRIKLALQLQEHQQV